MIGGVFINAIEQEKQRLISLVPENRRAALEAVIENLAFQRVKLEQTIDMIADQDLSITYDNGGGQKGIRENPAYRAYVSLWKSYLSGIEKVISAIPDEEQAAAESENVLQMVINRRRGVS